MGRADCKKQFSDTPRRRICAQTADFRLFFTWNRHKTVDGSVRMRYNKQDIKTGSQEEEIPMNLQGRDFLTLKDFTPDEIGYLLDLSAELKDKKKKAFRWMCCAERM